ncbi:hypothetical protein [Actimicrobium antarcticum]|uniref:Uncharacterized protein n=1 Tax=Actimicrobium antarcticum TaxID=1051899 RepID=A0ABP7STY2_9BURK
MNIKTVIFLAAACGMSAAWADGLALQPTYGLGKPAKSSNANAATSSNANAGASSNSASKGGSAQGVGSQGQSLSIDSHATYEAQSRNPVATAVAPALTSSNDTCMGSVSMGASAVSFGFSIGSSWTDNNCLMLKNAREIWNMGFKGAALARLCMDALNKEAFEATGVRCPDRSSATAVSAVSTSPTRLSDAGGSDNTYRY